ncbi:MAG: hypothetical protein HFG22_17550 [Lachnospiraceae bacterium]|nr:hypothetical protein [Lachnospiraceae bacterium]
MYSHYFALASIGFLYLILLVYIAKTRSQGIWKVLLSGGSVVVLLLPWLAFAKKTKGVVVSDYKIDQVSWRACLGYIFHSKYSVLLFVLFLVTLSIQAVFAFGLVQIKKDEGRKKVSSLRLEFRDIHMDGEWVWIISGVVAVFGTIAISEVISMLLYPIIMLRYLYPSFIMIWLLFAIDISKWKPGRLWSVLAVVFIFATCYPEYLDVIKNEHEADKRLKATLAATTPAIDGDAFIYTDIQHFDWSVVDVYYPETPHEMVDGTEWWGPDKDSGPEGDTVYWLFLGAPVSEEVTSHLGDMGYGLELVVDCGYMGARDVWIYKVIPENEDERGRS